MALFNIAKKKENPQTPVCSCVANEAQTAGVTEALACCCAGAACVIKVLGSGCKNCRTLLENTKEAVKAMGLSCEVEYVTDMQKIMDYGVMSTPALVVNETIVSMGRVLKAADIEKLLRKLGC